MKRLAILALLAMLALSLLSGSGAQADSICFKTGLRIFGEPWLAHQFCAPCPSGGCPVNTQSSGIDLGLDGERVPLPKL